MKRAGHPALDTVGRMRRTLTTVPVTLVALTVALTACGSDEPKTERKPSTTTASTTAPAPGASTTTAPPNPRNARFKLTPVADVDDPIAMAVRAGDPGLYFAEHVGRVVAVRNGALDPTPVIDLRDTIAAGGERGLLGLAFSPDGATMFVNYTNTAGDTRVDAYPMRADRTADRRARRELLAIDQPQPNHNGGNLVTGPDGMLWVATGDGGGGGDVGEGHAPGGNGQSLRTLLGKLLRIDPTKNAGGKVGVPPDNPFVAGGGLPEIWAYGLRNPWRFSFDAETGALVVADVGQNEWEEINWVAPGTQPPLNFGWPLREANHEFSGERPAGGIEPILEYPHDGRCSVTGGYVYRGTKIPDLVGTFLFADYCDDTLRGTPVGAGVRGEDIDLGVEAKSVNSFGQDQARELYVLSKDSGVLRIDPA